MATYLGPASTSQSRPLATTPTLALLPFSLGPAHTPFTTTSAPIAQFFQPRPCPPDVPGIPPNTPIASFRGRQLVGQTIDIPGGYRGVVLSAPLPHHVDGQWPLTPAPSVASTSAQGTATTDQTMSSPGGSSGAGTRRSPRKSTLASVASTIKAKVKGAGQMALSRPKTRQAKTQTVKRKRYQLDSDEEPDDGHLEHAKCETPTKGKGKAGNVVDEEEVTVGGVGLPTIVVQDATPLKEPLPTPKRRLGDRGVVKERLPHKRSRSISPNESPSPSLSTSTSAQSQVSEGIIPSPATENDPPTFDSVEGIKPEIEIATEDDSTARAIPTSSTSLDSIKTELNDQNENEDGPKVDQDMDLDDVIPPNSRVLRPTSTFESFTLWTPDMPLPGFKQDELNVSTTVAELSDGAELKEKVEDRGREEVVEDGGVRLRKGWWRTGGAGEGGDEVVRALGEWIGLIEELNRPVYLDDLKDDDSGTD